MFCSLVCHRPIAEVELGLDSGARVPSQCGCFGCHSPRSRATTRCDRSLEGYLLYFDDFQVHISRFLNTEA